MRPHRRPSKTTSHLYSLPSDIISPHSPPCATSTPTDDPSNDPKTGKTSERLCKKVEKIQVLDKNYRPVKNINMLPDDVLLEVFDFYQKYCKPEFPFQICFKPPKWHILVHVCQRWRCIVFRSPRRLDLELICIRGTPVRKNLDCWPAFPIAIDFYSDKGHDQSQIWAFLGPGDDDNIIAALEHPNRVRRVGLNLSHSQLQKVSTAMQEPFPALTRLQLGSADGNVPVLPKAFLGGSAPRLQKFILYHIPFPALPTLLSSALDLVELRLSRIPETGYVSPEAMAAALAGLTRLETLWIIFQSPTSRPSPRYPPPLARTTVPALTKFIFGGVSEYLENFVVQINTPRLKCLKIRYFKQLDFQVPQLSQFFRRQEILNPAQLHNARVSLDYCSTTINLTSSYRPYRYFSPRVPRPDLQISCDGLAWQVLHLTQVLRQCFVVPSYVDHLSFSQGLLGADQHNGADDTEWLEFLNLFTAVKSLLVSEKIAGRITHALDRTTSEMVAEPLPALRLLQIRPEYRSVTSVEQFISLRRLSSQPITIVNTQEEFDRHWSLLAKEEEVPDTLVT